MKDKKDILSRYVCIKPFAYIDVQPDTVWVCCPSWVKSDITVRKENNVPDIQKSWNSENAGKLRKSILDGSYSECNHTICPSLSVLINTGNVSSNFITREEFDKEYSNKELKNPNEILFGFDRSCNLKCPSCRKDTVVNSDTESEEYMVKIDILNQIEEISLDTKRILITGSGDPIYSKIYRDYLINFDAKKYPKLEEIQLITNGVLLNEKMWNSLNCKEYIKKIEISIDAGNKNTYEQVTRLNGDWDKLIENIKFLSTQNSIELMIFSMVVSKNNFKEMLTLYNIIKDIFKNSKVKYSVNYRQLVYWESGKHTKLEIKELSIFDKEHPLFNEFYQELIKIHNLPNSNHNFNHLLYNEGNNI